MRRTWLALPLVLTLFLPLGALAQGATGPLPEFASADAAQQHCPGDMVVWVNLRSSVYHFRGERWYGRTKNGTFVCRREADAHGMRATRNGQ